MVIDVCTMYLYTFVNTLPQKSMLQPFNYFLKIRKQFLKSLLILCQWLISFLNTGGRYRQCRKFDDEPTFDVQFQYNYTYLLIIINLLLYKTVDPSMGCVENASNANVFSGKPIQQELPSRKELQNHNQINAKNSTTAIKEQQKEQRLRNVPFFKQKIQTKSNEKLKQQIANSNEEEQEKQYLQICYQKAIKLFEGMKTSEFDLMFQQIKKIDPEYEYCQGWILKSPNNYIPHLFLAVACYTETKYQQTQKFSRKCIQLNPKAFRAYNLLANCYKLKKEIENAKIQYQKCIKINPKFQTAYQNLGLICRQEKQYQEGINWYLQAISINPKKQDTYIKVGYIYHCMEDFEKAIEYFRKCLSMNPKNQQALYKIGQVCYKLQNYDEAIFWFKKCIQVKPKSSLLYHQLGAAYLQKGQFDQTIKYFKKCLQIGSNDEQNESAMYNLGLIFTKQNQIKEAIIWLQKALKLAPNQSRTYNALGNAYFRLDSTDKARQCYQKSLQLNPKNELAYNGLGRIYQKQNPQLQIQMYKKCIQVNPRQCGPYYNIGQIYFAKQQYEEAIIWYKKSLEIDSKNYEYSFQIGGCYHRLRKYNEAIQQMQDSLQICPNNVFIPKLKIFHWLFRICKKQKKCLDENQKYVFFHQKTEKYIRAKLKKFQEQSDSWKEKIKNCYLKEEDQKEYQIMRKKFEDKFVKVFKNDQNKDRKKQIQLESQETQQFLKTMKLIGDDKYELSNIVEITKTVKCMYNDDRNKFHIIPRLICQSFWVKHFKKGQISEKIQQFMKNIIFQLCQEFPSTNKKSENIIDITLPEQYRNLKRVEVNIFQEFEYFSSYEVLFAEIQKVNYRAMQQLIPFRILVNKIAKNCKGDHHKFGLKLPSRRSQWFKVLIRILQKMFKEELKGNHKNVEIIRKINLQLLTEKSPTMKAIVLAIMKVWIEEINSILKTRKEMKIPTRCFVSDLIRGKCLFNSISDIAAASEMIIKECHQKNFQICQIDNKLDESAQSFVFKIKIKSIVAEFQLALTFDETQFQFGHSLYEIERSPLGTIFGSYLFLSKGVKYDMIAQSRDILNEMESNNTSQFDYHIKMLGEIIQDFEETSK